MRNPNRIFPFCENFAATWEAYCPDLRFWQFASVVAGYMESDYFKKDPFYAEEKDWEKALDRLTANYESKS